jgi:hypothetical protein
LSTAQSTQTNVDLLAVPNYKGFLAAHGESASEKNAKNRERAPGALDAFAPIKEGLDRFEAVAKRIEAAILKQNQCILKQVSELPRGCCLEAAARCRWGRRAAREMAKSVVNNLAPRGLRVLKESPVEDRCLEESPGCATTAPQAKRRAPRCHVLRR